jgi:hypothetical protein
MREKAIRRSRETRLSLQDFENDDSLTDVFALNSDTKIQHFQIFKNQNQKNIVSLF